MRTPPIFGQSGDRPAQPFREKRSRSHDPGVVIEDQHAFVAFLQGAARDGAMTVPDLVHRVLSEVPHMESHMAVQSYRSEVFEQPRRCDAAARARTCNRLRRSQRNQPGRPRPGRPTSRLQSVLSVRSPASRVRQLRVRQIREWPKLVCHDSASPTRWMATGSVRVGVSAARQRLPQRLDERISDLRCRNAWVNAKPGVRVVRRPGADLRFAQPASRFAPRSFIERRARRVERASTVPCIDDKMPHGDHVSGVCVLAARIGMRKRRRS